MGRQLSKKAIKQAKVEAKKWTASLNDERLVGAKTGVAVSKITLWDGSATYDVKLTFLAATQVESLVNHIINDAANFEYPF
jgi:hypothetical protein